MVPPSFSSPTPLFFFHSANKPTFTYLYTSHSLSRSLLLMSCWGTLFIAAQVSLYFSLYTFPKQPCASVLVEYAIEATLWWLQNKDTYCLRLSEMLTQHFCWVNSRVIIRFFHLCELLVNAAFLQMSLGLLVLSSIRPRVTPLCLWLICKRISNSSYIYALGHSSAVCFFSANYLERVHLHKHSSTF